MKIIVDTLGLDKGPITVLEGVTKAIENLNIECVLVGPKNVIEKFNDYEKIKEKIEIIDTEEYIQNTEEPTLAVRRKKNASINLPSSKGRVVLLDLGANIECTPEILKQFAIMGNVYAKETLGIEKPRLALLNIGAEEGKGTKQLKETYEKLKEIKEINFVGNIEARDAFDGNVDVIVCDGFHGNVLLKTVEGTAKFIMDNMKKSIMSSFLGKIGGLLIKNSLKEFKKILDYREYGACPMLGLNRVVFKGHGSSDDKAVYSGIVSLVDYIEKDINNKIKNVIEKGEK